MRPTNRVDIDLSEFLAAIRRAVGVVPSESQNPHYARIRLKAVSEKLSVMASSGDQSFFERLSVVSDSDFDVLVLGSDLASCVALAKDELSLAVEGNTLWLFSGDASWSLPFSDPSSTFPIEFEMADSSAVFYPVPRSRLLGDFDFVKDAVPNDGMRLALYQIDVRGGSFVACDGLRLHRTIDDSLDLTFSIAASGVSSVLRVLRSLDVETIYVGVSDDCVYFVAGAVMYRTRQSSVPFPDGLESMYVGQCLTHEHRFSVDCMRVLQAIKNVMVHVDSATHAMLVRMSANGLAFSSSNGKGSTALFEMSGKVASTQTLVLNADSLLAGVRSLALRGHEQIEFCVGEPKKKELVMLSSGTDTVVLSQLSTLGV